MLTKEIVPKKFENVFNFYPMIFGFFAFLFLGLFISTISLFFFVIFTFWVFVFPPLLWRFFVWCFGNPMGDEDQIDKSTGSLWTVSQKIQIFYEMFPFFERLLHLVPGLYSQWLRLWGSRVGHNVDWHYSIKIFDRAHMQIGDDVKFGKEVTLSSHKLSHDKLHLNLLVIPSNTNISDSLKLDSSILNDF
jgi:hypothetical protein